MTLRQIEAMTTTQWRVAVQHPAVRLTLLTVDQIQCEVPDAPGCYVPLAVARQRCYVGTSDSLRARVPGSIAKNLPDATHVLLIEPLGVVWSDEQRLALEGRLIAALPGVVNKSPGRRAQAASPYLDAVVLEVRGMVVLLLPLGDAAAAGRLTQGHVVRRLVLGEHNQPPTMGDLADRLRALGWSASGGTVYRTIRRDLRDRNRGGSPMVQVTGPWSDPATVVYVEGRRYSGGWRPPRTRPAETQRRP